jgi:hypothetical protein
MHFRFKNQIRICYRIKGTRPRSTFYAYSLTGMMLCAGAVDLLCQLTHKFDPSLRLNGVWGLMNMSFNAEQKIKSQIMTTLGTDQVPKMLI